MSETAMGELNNGIEELEVASSDVNPDIQAALYEQIEVLQEQQQAASRTLDELKATSDVLQPYLQAHFESAWNEIVTQYKAAALLLILDAMCTGCISA
jgi:predicted  nucleic acid-binding Zn-ribbon protein